MDKEECMIHKIDNDFPKCKRLDSIAVNIQQGDDQLPICQYHWEKLVEKMEPED